MKKIIFFTIISLLSNIVLSKEITIENNFKEINFVDDRVAVKVFLIPTWEKRIASSPYSLVIWITPKNSEIDCDFLIKNLAIKVEDTEILSEKLLPTRIVDLKNVGLTIIGSIRNLILKEMDYNIEFEVYSKKCKYNKNFREKLVFFKKEHSISFWDKLMGI